MRADILQVERRTAPQLTLEIEAPLILAGVRQLAGGRDDVGRAAGPTGPEGFANDSVGFAGSEVKVVTAASGGLLVRNVNEFIWFGL